MVVEKLRVSVWSPVLVPVAADALARSRAAAVKVPMAHARRLLAPGSLAPLRKAFDRGDRQVSAGRFPASGRRLDGLRPSIKASRVAGGVLAVAAGLSCERGALGGGSAPQRVLAPSRLPREASVADGTIDACRVRTERFLRLRPGNKPSSAATSAPRLARRGGSGSVVRLCLSFVCAGMPWLFAMISSKFLTTGKATRLTFGLRRRRCVTASEAAPDGHRRAKALTGSDDQKTSSRRKQRRDRLCGPYRRNRACRPRSPGRALNGSVCDAFCEAVRAIGASGGRSSSPASASPAISAPRSPLRFASTGTPAFFVHPVEANHGDLGMIAPDDVVLAHVLDAARPRSCRGSSPMPPLLGSR